MRRQFFSLRFRRTYCFVCVIVSLGTGFLVPAPAVTRFAPDIKDKLTAVPIDFANLWFYDRDGIKVFPEPDTGWVTVVFHPSIFEYAFDSTEASAKEAVLRSVAQTLVDTYEQVVDFYYDANLAEGACFLQLRQNMESSGLQYLIAQLNADNTVAYAHPTLRIKGKTYAFFNAFELEWKSGVSQEQKDLIMTQAAVSYDAQDGVYRVNLFQSPLFTALSLLAEDVRVQHATPVLAGLTPSLTAELDLAMSGSTMGDTIPFSLKVTFSDRIHIDPASVASINLKPAEIQQELFEIHFDPYDYVEAAAKSPIVITGWMRCYAPGDFLIPPVTIRYTCPACSGTQVRSMDTNALHFRVSSLLPAKAQENTLIIPMDLPARENNTALYHGKALRQLLYALLSCAAVLGCMGWLIARIRRKRQEETRLRGVRPEAVIAEELRRLLQRDPSTPHWSYVASVSRLVRAYVVARHQIPNAPTGGSGKMFCSAVTPHVPEPFALLLQRVLFQADEAVALEAHPFAGMEPYREDVLQLIGFPLS